MMIRLKKKKNSISQSLWQIGKPDLNTFFLNFFFFPWAADDSNFEWVTTLFSMKYGTWVLDEQDTKQNTELKKSVVQSVLLCLSCLFIYILTSKFIKKKTEQKIKQKNEKLEFCWIKCAPKNKRARQLWDIQFIFFSLSAKSKLLWVLNHASYMCENMQVVNTLIDCSCITKEPRTVTLPTIINQCCQSMIWLPNCATLGSSPWWKTMLPPFWG